jgi:CBS domain-containing protein
MPVSEVMTRSVVTVRPETAVHEAARLMVTHGVSGLPVVDERGAVVGIVSEGDLIVRQRSPERRPWWRAFFDEGEALAARYRKAVGDRVADVMTRVVACVGPDASIATAAAILEDRRIRRLPVVEGGRLVGIVSRGDLIRSLATAQPAPAAPVSDAQILGAMEERLRSEPWTRRFGVAVQVQDGVLTLWGLVDSETEREAVETMARTVPGVRRVDNRTTVGPAVLNARWA